MRFFSTVMVRADLSFGDKAISGSRGDGPVFDDGVRTRISLIGVPAEASKSVAKLDDGRTMVGQ